LISLEIKGLDFPLQTVLSEVMEVCAPVGVNADSTSENAILGGELITQFDLET
jgi:hypothetical protein